MTSKKVGLSVCYDTKNFGSQLQVLATIQKIEDLGYSTEIIRYKKKVTPFFLYQQFPRLFNPYFIRSKMNGRKKRKLINAHPEISEKVKIRNKRFDQFVDIYFKNLSEPYIGWDALKNKTGAVYDGYLCGSDQLWLPNNLGSHFYTLEFAPSNKPKIAYATSFGVGQIPWYQNRRTSAYLKRFQAISSREILGASLIKDMIGKDVPVVVDPTLLLTEREWKAIIPQRSIVEGKYIFCYFLGKNLEHRKIANDLKQKTGFQIVGIPFLDNFVEEDKTFGDIQLFDVDAADYINLIRGAEYILTDSFHGSVFSILNHKKFVVLNRFADGTKNSRNSRIESLCDMIGLQERRYHGEIVTLINQEIDYEVVDRRLVELRNNSNEYLRNALNILNTSKEGDYA